MSSANEKVRSLSVWIRWLPWVVAAGLVLVSLVQGEGGIVEIKPGEVAVKYDNLAPLLGREVKPEVITAQGAHPFWPGIVRVEKLEREPQIFVMEGKESRGPNQVEALTVRANDGSNFHFDRVEIHYQITPSAADVVIRTSGTGDGFKGDALRTFARAVLRDEFGRFSFLEIADPSQYGTASLEAKNKLNEKLKVLGIEITQMITPKPRFDDRVEKAIEDRQNAEQEVEVQRQKREKLEQEKDRRVQEVEQSKNAEYQSLVAELAAQRQRALNTEISVHREADKYRIDRVAEAEAYLAEKQARSRALRLAYRKEAEGLVAKIKAVGDQGPDVLNRVIAEKVFPQLVKIKASPLLLPSTPLDIRYLKPKAD